MGTAKHATSVLVVLSALVILLGTGGDSGQRTSVARQPSALKYATGSYRTYVAEENPAFLVTHRTDDDENKKSGQAERSTPQRSPAMPKEIVEELLRMDAYKLGIIVSEGDEGRERRISNSWPLALKFQPLREGLPAQHPEDSIWKDYEKIARVPFPFWYHVQVGQLDQRDETATVLFMISEGHDASYERNRLSWTAHNQAIIEEVNLGNDTTLVFPKSDDGAGRRLHVQLNVEKWKGEQYAIPQKSNVLTYNDNAVTPELGALQDAMWVGGGLIYNTESIDFLGQPGVPPGMPPESVQMLLRRHPYDVEIILSEGDEDNKRDVAGKTLLALKYQPTRGGRTAQHPDGSIWKDYKGITAGPKPLWYAVQILEQEGHTAKVLFVIAQASDFSYDGKRLAWTADMQAVIEEARLGEDTTIGLRRSGKDDAGQRLYVRLNVKKWDP